MQSTLTSHSGLAHNAKSLHESIPGKAIIVIAASLFVAACAHVSLPLPFTPVPLTLQPFAVILLGMILGPATGFATMVLYLVEGAAGLPVFTPHGPAGVAHLVGPSGGYLLSYPLAAAVAGWVVRRARFAKSRFTLAIIAGVLANVVVFTFGASWLAQFAHLNAASVWHMAVAPFLPGEAIKITAAASIFTSLQRWTRN